MPVSSKNDHHQIGQLMCLATQDVLRPQAALPARVNLHCRVGSGLATYHRFDHRRQQHLITYGVRMIGEKFVADKARNWLSAREIQQQHYFDGDVSVLNLLAHTCCHEFAHLLQHQAGKRHYRSVHNEHFYAILNKLHADGRAEDVREWLAEQARDCGLALPQAHFEPAPVQDMAEQWQVGDDIHFRNGQQRCQGRIIRVNRKTCTVRGTGPWGGRRYRVPMPLLRRIPT